MKIVHFCVNTINNNRGDEAITEAIHSELNNLRPDLKIMKVDIRILATGSLMQLIRCIHKAKLILIGGGGIYSTYFLPLRRSFLYILKLLKKPLVIIAPGLAVNHGCILGQYSTESIRLWNEYATLSSVRDEESRRFLKRLGIYKATCIGDPALYLTGLDAQTQKKKRVLGINLAAHGWNQQDLWLPLLQNVFIQLAKTYLSQGYEIKYMQHSKLESNVISILSKELPIEICNGTPKELIGMYKTLDLQICMMLHSAIFALNAEIPLVNIAYDSKNFAFMNMMGLTNCCLPIEKTNYEELLARSEMAMNQWKLIHENIIATKLDLHKKYQAFFKRVACLMK